MPQRVASRVSHAETLTEYVRALGDLSDVTKASDDEIQHGMDLLAPLVWREVKSRSLSPFQRGYDTDYWKSQRGGQPLRYPYQCVSIRVDEDAAAERAFEDLLGVCFVECVLNKLSYFAAQAPRPVEALIVTLIRQHLCDGGGGLDRNVHYNVTRGVACAEQLGVARRRSTTGRRRHTLILLAGASDGANPSSQLEIRTAIDDLPALAPDASVLVDGECPESGVDEAPIQGRRFLDYMDYFAAKSSGLARDSLVTALRHWSENGPIQAFLLKDLVYTIQKLTTDLLQARHLAEMPHVIAMVDDAGQEAEPRVQLISDAPPENEECMQQLKLLLGVRGNPSLREMFKAFYSQERSRRGAEELLNMICKLVCERVEKKLYGRISLAELADSLSTPRSTIYERLTSLRGLLEEQVGLDLSTFVSTKPEEPEEKITHVRPRGSRMEP